MRRLLSLLAVGLLAGTLAVVNPTSASAARAGTQGCQSDNFQFSNQYYFVAIFCSGPHLYNDNSDFVSTGPWSGHFRRGGTTWYFCDWQTYRWSYVAKMTEVNMYANKASWCP